MNLLPGATFIATLAIAVPVWAEGVEINVVTPSTVQRPPPETAPGGTVVLRGSPVNSNASRSPGTSGEGYGSAGYNPPIFLNYGADLRFDGYYDTTGFNRRFDGSGLTR
jgi:hypothetical protein